MTADLLYDYRRQVSAGMTACLLAMAIGLSLQSVLKKHDETEVRKPPPLIVELVAAAPEPRPLTPVPAEPPRATSRPLPAPRTVSPVSPVVRPDPAQATAAGPTPVAPAASALAPAPLPVAHVAEAPVREASPVPAPAVANVQADQRYEAVLKTYIESRKSYPAGRQAVLEKPEGTAYMCLRLNRRGSLVEASVRGSSGSGLLDQAARRLLAGLSYPPFEEMAFRGQDEHEFCVHLKYEAPQG